MIKAKKKYGQNFLIDKGVIKKIIEAINPKSLYQAVAMAIKLSK